MALADGLEEARLVHHDLEALGREPVELGHRGQLHRRLRRRRRPSRTPCRAGPCSSQPSRRRRGVSFGARAARSGARNGLASWRDSTVRRHDLALGERGGHDARCDRSDVGDDELVGGELGARLEQPVAAHALGDRAMAAWSTSSSWMSDVSRAAVFARIVATPSRRLSSSARAASASRRVGLDAGALLAHEEGDHLELHPVGGAELAALGLRLDLAHLAGEDRDDGRLVVAARRRGFCDAGVNWRRPGRRFCAADAVVGMLLLSVSAGCSGGDRSRTGEVGVLPRAATRMLAVTNAGRDVVSSGRGHSLLRAATSGAGSRGSV